MPRGVQCLNPPLNQYELFQLRIGVYAHFLRIVAILGVVVNNTVVLVASPVPGGLFWRKKNRLLSISLKLDSFTVEFFSIYQRRPPSCFPPQNQTLSPVKGRRFFTFKKMSLFLSGADVINELKLRRYCRKTRKLRARTGGYKKAVISFANVTELGNPRY